MSPFKLRYRVTQLSLCESDQAQSYYCVTLEEVMESAPGGPSAPTAIAEAPSYRVENVTRAQLLEMAIGDEFELTLSPHLSKKSVAIKAAPTWSDRG